MTNAEAYEAPHVPEDCRSHRHRHLIEILMGQNQRHPILSGLRENGCEAVCGEVAEFVEITGKINPPLWRYRSAAHCGQLHRGYQKGAKEIRWCLAKPAFGQVDD